MKVTINDINLIQSSLKSMVNDKSLSTSLKMQLVMMIDPVDSILEKADGIRRELITEMGETHEDGSLSVPNDKIPEFQNKLLELYNVEVEVPEVSFAIEDFSNSKELSALEIKRLIEFSKKYSKNTEEQEVE